MWAVSPIPCFIGSVASIGRRFIPCRGQMVRVCPLSTASPLQVRAVVAMVKFSHLTNFVLNKKLGCIIQNCSLGGCPLSPASSARWLPLVAVLFPCRVQMVWVCHWWRFYSLAGVNGLGVSLVAVLFPCRGQWFGCVFLNCAPCIFRDFLRGNYLKCLGLWGVN